MAREDNYGSRHVTVKTSAGANVDTFGGSGGTASADGSAFTFGTTSETPTGLVVDDVAVHALLDGQTGAARMSKKKVAFANPHCDAGTQSSVVGAIASTTLLAANVQRVGATVFNDSTATLYVKLGATASTSSFSAKLLPNAYYEVPYGYAGVIDGIWDAAAGNARITELT